MDASSILMALRIARLWISAFLLIVGVGLALRIAAAYRPLPANLGDYAELSVSLRETGIFGWQGTHTADRGIAFPSFIAALGDPNFLPWVNTILGTLVVALAGWLGYFLGSPAAGLFAATLTAVHPALIAAVPTYALEPFYSVLLLSTCAAAALWSWSPTFPNTCLLGFGVAVSLLCRSTLFLFPPIFAIAARTRPCRKSLALRGLFILSAYFLLAPWVARNVYWFRQFIPFEKGPAAYNLLAASVGEKYFPPSSSTEDAVRRIEPAIERANDPFQKTLKTSWTNIRTRPTRYIISCIRRISWALSLHPWLYLLAAAGVLFLRTDVRVRAAAILAVYFVGVHAFITAQPRFFDPLLPVVFVLCGCGFSELLRLAIPRASSALCNPGASRETLMTRSLWLTLAPLYTLCVAALAWELSLGWFPCRLPAEALTSLRCGQKAALEGDQKFARLQFSLALSAAEKKEHTPPFLRSEIMTEWGLSQKGPIRIDAFDKAVAADPGTVYAVAFKLQGQGRWDAALNLFDALVERQPRNGELLTDRGIARFMSGQPAEAANDFQRALRLDPTNHRADESMKVVLGR